MPEWKWYGHPVYRYRDEKGRFTAFATVREYGDQSRAATIARVREAALAETPPAAFEKLMREQLKAEVIRQYLLGRGGLDSLTKADYGAMGGVIADQYRYLDDFMARIEAGKYSAKQIANIAEMYINSTREAFERARARARGLPPMPAYPGDGNSKCLTNCRCYWDYNWTKGHWECYWRITANESCEDCLEHAQEWSPLKLSPEGEEL